MKFKKGVLNLEVVQKVIGAILLLSVLAIAMFAALNTIGSNSTLGLTQSETETVLNERPAYINQTGYLLSGFNTSANGGWSQIKILNIYNATNGTAGQLVYNSTVVAANYTWDNSTGLLTNATAYALYTNVSINYTYVQTYPTQTTGNVINNVTSGTTSFFSNVPTFMTLLGVVIILTIIGLVIVAVNRFSGGGSI